MVKFPLEISRNQSSIPILTKVITRDPCAFISIPAKFWNNRPKSQEIPRNCKIILEKLNEILVNFGTKIALAVHMTLGYIHAKFRDDLLKIQVANRRKRIS
jgi:hypothetical protein